MATCLPIGEHTPIPISDLAENAASKFLRENPSSKPRWCLRKSPHDVVSCTFLHRTPEKAANYITVRGEPAPVSIDDLLPNKGLEDALVQPEVFAEWCSVAAPHEVATCKNIHLGEVKNDKTVLIEGEDFPVNVSHLLLNRGVSFLLNNNSAAKGVWCNNKIIHDVLGCSYVHRRIDDHPLTINIEGEKFPIPAKDLVRNKGLEFLLQNPQYSGRWCSLFTKHSADECGYLHRLHPFIRVDGESIRVSLLIPNRGLKYVLEHPEIQGHWCNNAHDEAYPIDTCTYIHAKDEERLPAHVRHRRTESSGRRGYSNGGSQSNSHNGSNKQSYHPNAGRSELDRELSRERQHSRRDRDFDDDDDRYYRVTRGRDDSRDKDDGGHRYRNGAEAGAPAAPLPPAPTHYDPRDDAHRKRATNPNRSSGLHTNRPTAAARGGGGQPPHHTNNGANANPPEYRRGGRRDDDDRRGNGTRSPPCRRAPSRSRSRSPRAPPPPQYGGGSDRRRRDRASDANNNNNGTNYGDDRNPQVGRSPPRYSDRRPPAYGDDDGDRRQRTNNASGATNGGRGAQRNDDDFEDDRRRGRAGDDGRSRGAPASAGPLSSAPSPFTVAAAPPRRGGRRPHHRYDEQQAAPSGYNPMSVYDDTRYAEYTAAAPSTTGRYK